MQSLEDSENRVVGATGRSEPQNVGEKDTYRSHVNHVKKTPVVRQFEKDETAQYTTRFLGPVMNVTITNHKQDNGKWVYQVRDSAGNPVQSEGRNEPDWIPEDKLR